MSKRLIAMCIVLAALIAPAHADLTLSHEGKTDYTIILADDAIESERTAAKELSRILNEVTGAEFKVYPPNIKLKVRADAPMIYVGPSAAVKHMLPDFKWAELGADGIVIRTVGNKLVLAGGRPRGSLYAVFTFLEDHVGCRWWTSSERSIPQRPMLKIPRLDRVYSPPIRIRETFFSDLWGYPADKVPDINSEPGNYKFAAKLRLNGHFTRIPASWGGHQWIIGWCHTFYQFLPPEVYYSEHPEWYSLIDGERVAGPHKGQLCLTNDEMRREITGVMLERIRNDPDAGMISLSQNDWGDPCQCANCQAVAREEGSESGPLIRFVNRVAEDIVREFPNFKIETLAYQYTRKPPLEVRPSEHVVVRLCNIEADFFRPLDSEANATFRDDIEQWSAIASNLYAWDYIVYFGNFLLPYPNLHVLGPNLRYIAEHNAYGVFEQGNGYSIGGEFSPLKAWVIAHLLWDPPQDADALIREFVEGYYGPAAPTIMQYIALIRDAFARGDGTLTWNNLKMDFMDLDRMVEAQSLFDKAMKAVGEDAALRKRVRRARLPLDHVWLLRWHELKAEAEERNLAFTGPADPQAAYIQFICDAMELEGWHYQEQRRLQRYLPELAKHLDGT